MPARDQNTTYGEWALSSPPIPPARVDRILGVRVKVGPDGRPAQVDLQYKSTQGPVQQVAMGLGDALFLLSTLKSMQLDFDLPFPDDPRDPNQRAADFSKK